ncbi:polysaccharide deacetylase family protein [Pseudothermotoga thermarum]|uniref:Polysaccharide deacetylase n=1 Tax=Pseudothermotoga thermarum DSM 5069 TaxID=688269 RepID=F7YUL1_9THEM|nr:polysaccharide deacetylase family protein [Pseudothermotoga thermarum]AEH51484.1 polysaccharide deacetylase [Pseudothermotoga thermarum DSM 5069]
MLRKITMIILFVFATIYHASVVIFLYHRFDDARYPTTNTWTYELERHIQLVKELGFEIWTLKDLEDYAYGRKSFDGKAVIFTVDDGYRSVYQHAYPVFKKYNVPFAVFLQVGAVGYPDYLTWDMIREMLKDGVEFANHSFSHEDFPKFLKKMPLSDVVERFRNDTRKANQIFYEKTGYQMRYYAYPYGHYLQEFFDVLKEEGFVLAFTQNPGPYTPEYGFYEIPREPLLEDWATEKHVRYILSRKPLVAIFQNFTVENGKLQLNVKILNPKEVKTAALYVSEKGTLQTNLKDSILQIGPIELTKMYNRLLISVRDKDNQEYVRYWLIYNVQGE